MESKASPAGGSAANADNRHDSTASFSQKLEATISQVVVTRDPFDAASFSAVDYINEHFPTEESLADVDEFVHRLRHQANRLDREVLRAVQQQSRSGKKATDALEDARLAIVELFTKINNIKEKSRNSESMVRELCRDIQSLDHAKRHLTATITCLRKMHMMSTAVERLEKLSSEKDYDEIASMLEAVFQLRQHFEEFSHVKQVRSIFDRVDKITRLLRESVTEDLKSLAYWASDERTPDNSKVKIQRNACIVADILGDEVRNDIVDRILSPVLHNYESVHDGGEMTSNLEKTESRFMWLRKKLLTFDERLTPILPASWQTKEKFVNDFCALTRKLLSKILEKETPSWNDADGDDETFKTKVGQFLVVVQKTIDFEHELARLVTSRNPSADERRREVERQYRMGVQAAVDLSPDSQSTNDLGSDDGIGAGNIDPTSVEGVKMLYKKYKQQAEQRRVRDPHSIPGETKDARQERERFVKKISSCFEPYMNFYVDLESRSLSEFLQRIIRDEKWNLDIDRSNAEDFARNQPPVLQGSAELFLYIKKSLRRCSSITRGKTLLSLFQVYRRVFQSYASMLDMQVARPAPGTDSLPVGPETDVTICLVLSTAEYIFETLDSMQDMVKKLVDEEFHESIVLEEEREAFLALTRTCMSSLVSALATSCDGAIAVISVTNWQMLGSVGDVSSFVSTIESALDERVWRVRAILSPLHTRYVFDKLVVSLAQRLRNAVLSCKVLGDIGAQQLLLDMQQLKGIFQRIPVMGMKGGEAPPASFVRLVGKEMGRIETILKVLLAPPEALGVSYQELVGNSGDVPLARIQEMKGLRVLAASEGQGGGSGGSGASASTGGSELKRNMKQFFAEIKHAM